MTAEPDTCGELFIGAPRIAEYLGLREGQVRHLIEAGRIPYFKIGKSVAARRQSLDRWIETLERQRQQEPADA